MIFPLPGKLMRGEYMKENRGRENPVRPLGKDGLTACPGPIITDPFGSYTGLVKDDDDKPVQDADDL